VPDLITRETEIPGSGMFYKLGAKESWILLAASFALDGSALNANYCPMIQVNSQSNWEMFLFGSDVVITQHGAPFVTFAPHLSPTASPVAATTTTVQCGMPQLEYGPGTLLIFGGRALTDFTHELAIVTSSLTLYVEGTHVGQGLENVGPFMLVPGPGAGL
jgi:hypothetical protein